MNILMIIIIAFGLAMDAFAVSVTSGLVIRRLELRHALRIAIFFGVFQAVMPIVGWLLGTGLRDVVANWDHWIAFGLLTVVGGKMIWEASQGEKIMSRRELTTGILFMLAIATSIDALVVGLTLSFLAVSILLPAVIIGVITFILSLVGVYIGKRVGHFCEQYIEIAGGLILIAIGIKILLDHLF